ncbi:MAG TPA: WXG100 family type VII secretion target [Actinocrinis sp.]|nr:WXG100 family type VII secretion target [Actinocrinis sp.]
MTGAQKPSTLASFSQDWVGGDIHGLSAFAGTVYGYLPDMTDVVTVLESSVAQIENDAGWTGAAATAFSNAWQQDALAVTAVVAVFQQIGDTVDALAVNLANIESALESAADEVAAQGVRVGPNGVPPTMPDGPYAVGSPAAKLQSYVDGYAAAYNLAMGEALRARNLASESLQGLEAQIAPPDGNRTSSPEANVSESTPSTLAAMVRSLWSVPALYTEAAEAKVRAAETTESDAVAAYKAAKKLYMANFSTQSAADAAKLRALGNEIGTARTELSAVTTKLDGAETLVAKFPGSKVLNTTVGSASDSLAKVFHIGGAGGAAGASDEATASALDKIIDFGKGLPVIDVLAVVAGTALDSDQSIRGGKPWYEAVPEDLLANVAGLAAGIGVLALLPEEATVAVVGVAVAGAAVLGMGVTDEIENLFSEHWSQDWHKSGVVAGTLDGIGHSVSNTVDEMGNSFKSGWNAVKSIF